MFIIKSPFSTDSGYGIFILLSLCFGQTTFCRSSARLLDRELTKFVYAPVFRCTAFVHCSCGNCILAFYKRCNAYQSLLNEINSYEGRAWRLGNEPNLNFMYTHIGTITFQTCLL